MDTNSLPDINSLPDEIFDDIACYLDVQDLLSCSLVCQRWRNIFSTNRIWQRVCVERGESKRLDKSLITASCNVAPPFPYPSTESEDSPCLWKLKYMQEVKISNNWRAGRYLSFGLSPTLFSQFIKCDDDVVAIGSYLNQEFSTWTIDQRPVKIQSLRYALKYFDADYFKLSNNILIIVQRTLLQIYWKDPNHMFYLRFRCLFNLDEKNQNVPLDPDITQWYHDTVGLSPTDDVTMWCIFNGQHFCASIMHDVPYFETIDIHIWDVTDCSKSLVFHTPRSPGSEILRIKFWLSKSDLFIILSMTNFGGDNFGGDTHVKYVLHKYCLKSFSFTNFRVMFTANPPQICRMNENYVVSMDQTPRNISVWCRETGRLVHDLTCEFDIKKELTQFATKTSILYCKDSHNSCVINIFDLKTLQVTFQLALNHRVSDVKVIKKNFLLVGNGEVTSVWDLKTSRKLYLLDYVKVVWTNNDFSKAIVLSRRDVHMLLFW